MIKLTETDESLIMTFNNGIINIPKEYGAYAICPGCGSGKTTISKELIRTKWHEGILYAAFTRDELDRMYQYCLTLVGSKVQDEYSGEILELKLDDIMVLHSDYSKEGTNENIWRNMTYELANKKILLCTHAKLQTEPMELLMAANFTKYLAIYDPQTEIINGLGKSLPRQWMIIDEIPDPKYVTKEFRRFDILMTAGVLRDTYKNEVDLNTGMFKSIKCGEEYHRVIYSQYQLNLNTRGRYSVDLRKVIINQDDDHLNRFKKKSLGDTIYRKFNEIKELNTDDVTIKYMFTDMINPEMKTHVLLMDGTADISLPTSSKFKLLNINGHKYNGKSYINSFPFHLTRRLTEMKLNEDEFLINKIDETAMYLIDIIKQNKQTLIFTWKNLKELDEVGDDGEISDGKLVETKTEYKTKLNENHLFHEYLKTRIEILSNYSLRSGRDFSIEYYGSGKDKAINDYRDYDAIILCGKYQVPNKVFGDFDNVYSTRIENAGKYYYLNRIIQMICRTRIRKHDGSSINVYFSNDWNKQLIAMTDNYMNDCELDININPDDLIELMKENLKIKGVTPERADRIARLSLYDNQIYHSIMNNCTYSTALPLSILCDLIPMSRKNISTYRFIKNWLSIYGIKIEII